MTYSNYRVRIPFAIETVALFIIPFEELLALSFGSALRLINLLNIAVIIMLEKRIKLDWNKTSPIGPMAVFIAYAALSGIWCFNRGLYLDRLVTYGLYTVLILLLRTLNPNEWEKKSMLRGLFFGGILATIMLLYNTRIRLDIGGGRETIAIAGRKVDANILSVSMVISFVIALYHLLYDKQSALIRRI